MVDIPVETDLAQVLEIPLDHLAEPLLHLVAEFDVLAEVELEETLKVHVGIVVVLDGAMDQDEVLENLQRVTLLAGVAEDFRKPREPDGGAVE